MSIRKDHNIEVVNRFFKNTFVQVKQNNDASGICPKKSEVDISLFHSELSWENELYESDTSKLYSVSFKRGWIPANFGAYAVLLR